MHTINKGDGSGTGDSVKQALMKSADNFAELDARVIDMERLAPRKFRGSAPAPVGFPQEASAKGSPWTGATRKGQLLFTAGTTVFLSKILVLPSGRIVVSAGGVANDVMQLASVDAAGVLTAIGVPLQVASSSSIVSWGVLADNTFMVLTNSNVGSANPVKSIYEASEAGLTLLHAGATSLTRGSRIMRSAPDPRAMQTQSGIAAVFGEYYTGGLNAGYGTALASSDPAEIWDLRTIPHAVSYFSGGQSSTQYNFVSQSRLASDMAIVCGPWLDSDGANRAGVGLVQATDLMATQLDFLVVDQNPPNGMNMAVALSPSRAIVRPNPTSGAIGIGIVDGELQRLSQSLQTQGVLQRSWRAVVQQDDTRALVFEQQGDLVAPTVITLDPVTGDIAESGTVPVLFGTSGYVFDAYKIGPNRVLVSGRAGATTTQAALEVWDLS